VELKLQGKCARAPSQGAKVGRMGETLNGLGHLGEKKQEKGEGKRTKRSKTRTFSATATDKHPKSRTKGGPKQNRKRGTSMRAKGEEAREKLEWAIKCPAIGPSVPSNLKTKPGTLHPE